MKTALVIGGTGPTGPHVVNGLLARGWQVTILHSGRHEVAFDQEIEHLHADVHFREPLLAALGRRQWDLVLAAYGRLKLNVEVFRGRTGRMVAIGGATAPFAPPGDPRWGPMGPPHLLDEDSVVKEDDPARNKFGYQVVQAEAALFAAHEAGHYAATYLAFPMIYGPRQPGAHDWSIVRRVLDGRRRFILPDGGIKLETRAFAENAAHATLLAIDQPAIASGRRYLVGDEQVFSMRQRVEAVARALGHAFEFVDMPYELALPSHVPWRRQRENRLRDTHRIRAELGYRDVVPVPEAIARTARWLAEHRASVAAEIENQLGDPFDYAREDALIARWLALRETMGPVDYPLPPPAHMYRHPDRPGEDWKRPGARA